MIRRTIAEIHTRARDELVTNYTITTYAMVNGAERREPPRLSAAFAHLTNQMALVTMGFDGFAVAVDKAMEPLRRMGSMWIPIEISLGKPLKPRRHLRRIK